MSTRIQSLKRRILGALESAGSVPFEVPHGRQDPTHSARLWAKDPWGWVMGDGSDRVLRKIEGVKRSRSKSLHLSRERLTRIPDEVFELTWLKQLYLSSNQLSTVPESITRLSNLTRLSLISNTLEDPPLEIAVQGIEAIRDYSFSPPTTSPVTGPSLKA